MGHDAVEIPVIAAQAGQFPGIGHDRREMLEEARQAGIQRFPAQNNDPRLGQQQRDHAQVQEVAGHLVGNAKGVA